MNMHKKTKNLLIIFTVFFIVLAGNAVAGRTIATAASAKNGWVQSNGIGTIIRRSWLKTAGQRIRTVGVF